MIFHLITSGLCLILLLPLESNAAVEKTKRYLSHGGSSPCPPFYPNFGIHESMHMSRPYGPPAYPKLDIRPAIYTPEIHHSVIPAATYHTPETYHPPIKPAIYHVPVMHHPPVMQIPHAPVIKPAIVESSYPVYSPKYDNHPVHNYAPYYPAKWPMPEMKKILVPKVTGVVYKPEPPKCPACPSHSPPVQISKPVQPVYYSKIIKPVLQPAPPKFYVPAHHEKPCL